MSNVYLITGAASELGCALIKRLYCEGDRFIVQDLGNLSVLAPLCKKYPGAISTFQVDLADANALAMFTQQVAAHCPAPTHYIALPHAAACDFSPAQFELDASAHLHGAVALCRTFLPAMETAKFGRILFLLPCDCPGLSHENASVHNMAKSALHSFAKSLAAQYAACCVTINCVAPYLIEPKNIAPEDTPFLQASAKNNPMKRNARIEDIVPAMAFLLSRDADFITGATIPVNGGSTAQ